MVGAQKDPPDAKGSEAGSKAPEHAKSDADESRTQIDEAKDEGAGKLSVPIDQVTTANDE